MQYFTDSFFERLMRMPPDKSEVLARRSRKEMMEEYNIYKEREAAEKLSGSADRVAQ